MKNQGGGPLVLSPELWAGVAVPFDQKFQDEFKRMVAVSAWDPQSRTRWFPISYLPFVKQLVREAHLAADAVLDNSHAVIQRELDRRRVVKAQTTVDGVMPAGGLADDYTLLGLHPSCSGTLVEWAIMLARKEGSMLGAPTTELLYKEEAYRRICAGAQAVRP